MNLRQLEAFRAVMRSGSVTEAGKLLRLTQPTISKLIAQLERSSGLKLFVRDKGRLVPRPEAEKLLRQADRVFSAVEELGRNAKRLATGAGGHLRIVAIPPLAMRFLPDAVTSFLERRPDVRITLNVRGSSYVPNWIATQQADIGFTSSATSAAGMASEGFMSGAAVCILPKGHRLAAARTIRPRDLEREEIISLGRETAFSHLLDRVFAEAGVTRNVIAETGYSMIAGRMVANGRGLAIIDPVSALDQFDSGDVVLRAFEPEVRFEIKLVHPAHGGLSLPAQAFLRHLEDARKTKEKRLRSALRAGLPGAHSKTE
jgi:DNA-binding transcriptional LysR family regulator